MADVEKGKGKIDLETLEMSITDPDNGRTYRIRAFSDTHCHLFVSAQGAEVYCAIKTIDELRNSSEVPDLVQWLARGFSGIPVRFKQAAYKKVVAL